MDDPGDTGADVGRAAPLPEDDAVPGEDGLRVAPDCHFVDVAVQLNYSLPDFRTCSVVVFLKFVMFNVFLKRLVIGCNPRWPTANCEN